MSFVGSSAMAIVLVALELPFGPTDLVISHDYEWNLLDLLAFTSYTFCASCRLQLEVHALILVIRLYIMLVELQCVLMCLRIIEHKMITVSIAKLHTPFLRYWHDIVR